MERVSSVRRSAGPWASRRDALFDLALMLLVQGLTVALLWPLRHNGWSGMVIELSAGCLLLVRRVLPLTVLFLMLLDTIALNLIGQLSPHLLTSMVEDMSQAWMVLAVMFVAYSAMAYGSDRRRAGVMIVIIILVAMRPGDAGLVARAFEVLLIMLVPTLLGHYVAGLNDRVERAEREQHRMAERARIQERVRLAAEMHDVVTHRISLMVLQAGALGVTATDPETRTAAEDLRAAGCQALDELRDLVGVLRSSPGEVAEHAVLTRAGGQAGAPDLDELLAESESVGIRVNVERHGDPSLASPVVARTAYRIIQESLTNVRKHAPGAEATVRIWYTTDQVRLTVRNGPPERGADVALSASGSGSGLLGLRQRVELVSGTLAAGPTEEGGFAVDATLPAYVPTKGHSRGAADPDDEPRRRGSGWLHWSMWGPIGGMPMRAHRARGGG